MIGIADVHRLEQRRLLLERVIGTVPYALLAASTALAWAFGEHDLTHQLWTLALVAATAAWLWLLAGRREPGVVFVVGVVLLIAALDSRDVWFAVFFGFTGYLYGWTVLAGVWRFVALTVTSLVNTTAIVGIPRTWWDAAPLAGIVVVTVLLVALFSALGELTIARSAAYQQTAHDLESALRELELLQQRLVAQAREAGVHEERRRLAREIHDTLAQDFTGIVTQLQAAERARAGDDQEGWTHHLGNALHLARGGLDEARRSVGAMTPAPLQAATLPDATATIVSDWAQRTGVRAELTTTGIVRPLHPEVEATLVRITQEALANVGKHAQASRVGVTLSYMDDQITLDIRDDGVGFEPGAGDGYGLTFMRQRATPLRGAVEIESAPGAGTAVSVSLPAVPGTTEPGGANE